MLADEVKAALEGATPGPWRYEARAFRQIIARSGRFLGQIYASRNAKKNGELIALAPDMARALIAAEEMADATEVVCDQVYNRVGGVSLQAVAALRAALTAYRKAGETNAD